MTRALDTNARFDRSTLFWIVCAALLARVLWSLMIPVQPLSDSHAYDTFARTLVEHGVFGWEPSKPFAFWPPGTSFLYAGMYWLFGFSYVPIVALNLALSVGIIVTSARLGERFFGARVGLATAIVMSAWPTLVLYPTIIASELPYLFFSACALDVWTAPRGHWALRALGAGVLLGIAALIRPLALALPAVYAGALLLQRGLSVAEFLKQFKTGVIVVAAMATVIAPWTWRNYQLYDELVLISTNGGITFWMGNTPGTPGSYMDIPAELADVPDNEQNRILSTRAREYIVNEPGAFVTRSLRKLAMMYSNESIGVIWNAKGIEESFGPAAVLYLKRATQVAWALILLLAIAGTIILIRKHGAAYVLFSPLVVSAAFYSFVYSVTVSQDRYHLSFAAQVGILAAAGALGVLERLQLRRTHVLTTPAVETG
jgi:4-amino-4-deoxy-L-arabinose transferase-like glycosyltransferase